MIDDVVRKAGEGVGSAVGGPTEGLAEIALGYCSARGACCSSSPPSF